MKRVLFFLLGFLLFSCSTVSYAPLSDQSFPVTDASRIQLYPEVPEDKEFFEIGYIAVQSTNGVDEVMRLLKKLAAEKGADAVVRFRVSVSARKTSLGEITEYCVRGLAIKFK
ncbi:MAG: hypothetical protein GXO78_13830 [Calditrichaeota bacterium]|nr:hypothetical protein [Calditrichota bacterium]